MIDNTTLGYQAMLYNYKKVIGKKKEELFSEVEILFHDPKRFTIWLKAPEIYQLPQTLTTKTIFPPECESLEYKKSLVEGGGYLKYVCGALNSIGGLFLLMGVKDDGCVAGLENINYNSAAKI